MATDQHEVLLLPAPAAILTDQCEHACRSDANLLGSGVFHILTRVTGEGKGTSQRAWRASKIGLGSVDGPARISRAGGTVQCRVSHESFLMKLQQPLCHRSLTAVLDIDGPIAGCRVSILDTLTSLQRYISTDSHHHSGQLAKIHPTQQTHRFHLNLQHVDKRSFLPLSLH
jgi:hypothetical protein